MIQLGVVRLIPGDEPAPAAEPPETPEPKVFVRTIAAPPGWPWDQQRAAMLDARHGAPLPLGEVAMRMNRIEAWRPGQAARYAAFYVRRGDVRGRLEATIDVAGQFKRVVFLAPGEQQRAARMFTLAAGAAFVVMAIVSLAIASAMLSRERAEDHLQAVEAAAGTKLRQARLIQARKAQAEALDAADRGQRLDSVLADLAWASTAKAPDARIEAWHWQGGLMAVEARGDTAPFMATDRLIQKAAKPLRKRVWLWGVAPAPRERPISAQPRGGQ